MQTWGSIPQYYEEIKRDLQSDNVFCLKSRMKTNLTSTKQYKFPEKTPGYLPGKGSLMLLLHEFMSAIIRDERYKSNTILEGTMPLGLCMALQFVWGWMIHSTAPSMNIQQSGWSTDVETAQVQILVLPHMNCMILEMWLLGAPVSPGINGWD